MDEMFNDTRLAMNWSLLRLGDEYHPTMSRGSYFYVSICLKFSYNKKI